MSIDEHYMRRCLQLARNGFQHARPNPMVGAVVVCGERIIGEGYHVRCGEGHAEVNALASVRPSDEHLLPESTIYVSLEPCAHYGKTPPCARLIVEKRLRRCVVGCIDPFSKVQGRGIAILREAGIDVTVGVLEQECLDLNKHFMTYHRFHRPFITLKWAETSDGFIGYADQCPGHRLTISNSLTRMVCHQRRTEHDAILVGRHTVMTDHPRLDVRHWHGDAPLRVVLAHNEVDSYPALYFSSVEEAVRGLYDRGVQSLLVEGGRQTLQSFIDRGLWDEAFVETGPSVAGEGVCSPVLNEHELVGTTFYGSNRMAWIKHR